MKFDSSNMKQLLITFQKHLGQGRQMRKLALLFFVLIPLLSSNVMAYDNICQTAQACLKQTAVEREKYFDRYLKNRRIEGSGTVKNVYEGHSTEYIVIVDCDNDVILTLISKSGGLKYLKLGDKISFRGTCRDLKINYHENDKGIYEGTSVKVLIEDTSISR